MEIKSQRQYDYIKDIRDGKRVGGFTQQEAHDLVYGIDRGTLPERILKKDRLPGLEDFRKIYGQKGVKRNRKP